MHSPAISRAVAVQNTKAVQWEERDDLLYTEEEKKKKK